MEHSTLQAPPAPAVSPIAAVQVAEELARCLARFLHVSADELTLQRSREVLAHWHRLNGLSPARTVCFHRAGGTSVS